MVYFENIKRLNVLFHMNFQASTPIRRVRNLIFLIVSISMAQSVLSQSITRWVISPFGNSYDNNFQIVQATLGEPNILTVTDSASFILTQGFQQPNPSELPDNYYTITIKVYPNPVISDCSIAFFVKDEKDFTIAVWDMMGNILIKEKLADVYSGQVEHLNFSGFTQGIYFIHVYSDTNQMQLVEKIVKL